MKIDTLQFSHILGATNLCDLTPFFERTAFVISHKSESAATLLGVIWYLPVNSPVLIVTNCALDAITDLERELVSRLEPTRQVYLIHQKDERIARFFAEHAVTSILGADGYVVNGKGEGMYIGALMTALLGQPEWLVFYDADNFVPSALLEYTLAMGRMFMQQRVQTAALFGREVPRLHNVRICWPAKPSLDGGLCLAGELGRCTRAISPLVTTLVREWFGVEDQVIISPNASEQGFTVDTLRQLQFSSGYSIETFQMLHLFSLARSLMQQGYHDHVLLYQYQAHSPHFHEKGDDKHIKQMIADSLGCFAYFEHELPVNVKKQVQQTYEDLELEFRLPRLYPTINELMRGDVSLSIYDYALFSESSGLIEREELCS
jgi:mannosyl-3-phosphoglycerate synthase